MRSIIAFICRALLLALYVVLGRYEYIATPLEVIERAVVTCLQICILGVAWVIFELCAFVVRALSRRAYARVDLNKYASEDLDLEDMFDEPEKAKLSSRPATPRSAVSVPSLPAVDGPPRFSIADSDSDVASSEKSLPPGPHEDSVTFASRLELARYVAKVHVIGIVVWTTMLSIDYGLSQTSFLFVLGMLLGNVATVIGGAAHPSMSLGVLGVYWGLSGTLVFLYLARDGASALVETETELGMQQNRLEWSQLVMAVNIALSPASCGFSWTFWMDARTLLEHYRTSLYTSVMLSVPVLIFVRGAYLVNVLAKYPAPWLAHVIVTEPVLKFMTIYAMTLSLDAEEVVEMLAVNTSVVGACYIAFEPHDAAFNAAVGVLIAALLTLHSTRIAKRVLRERARKPQLVIRSLDARQGRPRSLDTHTQDEETQTRDVYSHSSL